jgi:hypothetical protein
MIFAPFCGYIKFIINNKLRCKTQNQRQRCGEQRIEELSNAKIYANTTYQRGRLQFYGSNFGIEPGTDHFRLDLPGPIGSGVIINRLIWCFFIRFV